MRKWINRWLNKRNVVSAPKYIDSTTLVFVDSKDRRYFIFNSDNDIPLLRKLFITESYVNLVNGFTDAEVNRGLLKMHEAINEFKGGKMQPNIAKASFIITNLLNRSGRLIDEDKLYSLAAHYFIREDELYDENRGEVIYEIKQEKIEVLKREFSHGVRDWFFGAGLNKLYPFLVDDGVFFNQVLEETKTELEAYKQLIEDKHG